MDRSAHLAVTVNRRTLSPRGESSGGKEGTLPALGWPVSPHRTAGMGGGRRSGRHRANVRIRVEREHLVKPRKALGLPSGSRKHVDRKETSSARHERANVNPGPRSRHHTRTIRGLRHSLGPDHGDASLLIAEEVATGRGIKGQAPGDLSAEVYHRDVRTWSVGCRLTDGCWHDGRADRRARCLVRRSADAAAEEQRPRGEGK